MATMDGDNDMEHRRLMHVAVVLQDLDCSAAAIT